MISSSNTVLAQRPETFNGICISLAQNENPLLMRYYPVLISRSIFPMLQFISDPPRFIACDYLQFYREGSTFSILSSNFGKAMTE